VTFIIDLTLYFSLFRSGLSGQLLKRLKLTSEKIDSLVDGIRCIAKQEEPLDQVRDLRVSLSDDVCFLCNLAVVSDHFED
jgi:gamma-glutamyl phosphate reductase